MFLKLQVVLFIVILCIHSCFGLSIGENEVAQLTEYRNEITEDGYFFKFNFNDGQQREERGEIVKKGDKKILVVSGFYSYIGDDEKEHYTEYESDENGYRAETRVEDPSVQLPGSVLASLAGGGLG